MNKYSNYTDEQIVDEDTDLRVWIQEFITQGGGDIPQWYIINRASLNEAIEERELEDEIEAKPFT